MVALQALFRGSPAFRSCAMEFEMEQQQQALKQNDNQQKPWFEQRDVVDDDDDDICLYEKETTTKKFDTKTLDEIPALTRVDTQPTVWVSIFPESVEAMMQEEEDSMATTNDKDEIIPITTTTTTTKSIEEPVEQKDAMVVDDEQQQQQQERAIDDNNKSTGLWMDSMLKQMDQHIEKNQQTDNEDNMNAFYRQFFADLSDDDSSSVGIPFYIQIPNKEQEEDLVVDDDDELDLDFMDVKFSYSSSRQQTVSWHDNDWDTPSLITMDSDLIMMNDEEEPALEECSLISSSSSLHSIEL